MSIFHYFMMSCNDDDIYIPVSPSAPSQSNHSQPNEEQQPLISTQNANNNNTLSSILQTGKRQYWTRGEDQNNLSSNQQKPYNLLITELLISC